MSVVRYAVVLLVTLSAVAQQAPVKRERFQNSEVLYDWVSNERGEKLRTFVSVPRAPPGKCLSFSSSAG
jgi:hypothetical protein